MKSVVVATNEIPDNTVNGRSVNTKQKTICVICEFVLKEIDEQIKDKYNDVSIFFVFYDRQREHSAKETPFPTLPTKVES